MSWIPEADSKIFMQKSAVLEINSEKHLLKQPFFAGILLESGCAQIKKTTKEIRKNLFNTKLRSVVSSSEE
jgi:hypothetical protein